MDLDPREVAREAVEIENRKRSLKEVADFEAGTFDVYFAYYHKPSDEHRQANINAGIRVPCTITTWMGDLLATVKWTAPSYRCPFGDTRRNFAALGIDGRKWYGVYYESAGDYVRMRPYKNQKARVW